MKSLKKYIFFLLIFAILITCFNLLLFSESWTLKNTANMFLWCIMYTAVLGLGNAFLAQFLNNKYDWYSRTNTRIIVGIIYTILYSMIGAFSILFIMLYLFGDLQFSDLFSARSLTSYYYTTLLSIVISMFFHLRGFLIDWKAKFRQVEELKRKETEFKLASLQKQMDAHFLFNSLSVLREVVEEDQKLAGEFVEKFADVYRYIVDFGSNQTVLLKQELDFIKDYIFLHQTRFEGGLKVNFVLNNCDESKKILPLALQTAVENAIKHNVFNKKSPLVIDVVCTRQSIYVKNNVNLKMNTIGSKSGLQNLSDRLKLMNQNGLEIDHSNGHFKLEIPLL